MARKLDDLKEIDAYLAGELTPDQAAVFQERFRVEQGIKDDVEITRRLIKAIRGYGFKQMIKGIHRNHFEGGDSNA
jgi:hypothetical protein